MYAENDIFSRNYLFIDKGLQKKLGKIKLAIIGSGLSSQVSVLAARTGVGNFLIADGDVVELSNFNRQVFDSTNIGKNKAVAVGELINNINSDANVEVLDRNIELSDVDKVVKKHDFIICTVDVGDVYFKISESVQKYKKIGIFPLNVGYGSFVFVVDEGSKNFSDMFGNDLPHNDLDFYKKLFFLNLDVLPKYLVDSGKVMFSDDKLQYFSQLGIGAYVSAALVNMIILKILKNESVPLLPEPVMVDLNYF